LACQRYKKLVAFQKAFLPFNFQWSSCAVVGVGFKFFVLFCFYLERNLQFKKSERKSKTYLEAFSFIDKEAAVLNIFLALSYSEMFRIVSF